MKLFGFDLSRFKIAFLILLLLIVPLFFVSGPSAFSPEIYRRFWDLGHPIFFALLSMSLIWWGLVNSAKRFLVACVLVFASSLLIEKIQSYIGREESWLDVLDNMAGFLLGYAVLQVSAVKKYSLVVISFVALLPSTWNLVKSILLCVNLWWQFPVLLGGDYQWELNAWSGDIHSTPKTGYQLHFKGKAFDSIDMMGFIQSWKDFQTLKLEINNPSNDVFDLTLRISDKQHEMSDQQYSDRFNRRISIQPGEQTIQIRIQDIEQSPAGRSLNLDEIYLLELFLPEDGKARDLQVKKIYLSAD